MDTAEAFRADAALAGDTEAREVVARMYREHYAGLVRTVSLLIGDVAEAEDIVQEAHVRLYRSWGRIREPAAAHGYLRATALNLARSRLRKVIRGRGRHEEPAHVPAPDDAAIAGEAGASVISALRGLARRQRECLVLRYYAGMSDSQIAADLGVSLGSVKRHIHRGLEKLEGRLERYR
ncbi:MAG TPA: SigE family RNA polymerase sigma factor [Actinomycetota bacterium]|nr:SigE family RNA polymerase sigma factor [Actinomycetota bacterium]